jgi:hypothetical protein
MASTEMLSYKLVSVVATVFVLYMMCCQYALCFGEKLNAIARFISSIYCSITRFNIHYSFPI